MVWRISFISFFCYTNWFILNKISVVLFPRCQQLRSNAYMLALSGHPSFWCELVRPTDPILDGKVALTNYNLFAYCGSPHHFGFGLNGFDGSIFSMHIKVCWTFLFLFFFIFRYVWFFYYQQVKNINWFWYRQGFESEISYLMTKHLITNSTS